MSPSPDDGPREGDPRNDLGPETGNGAGGDRDDRGERTWRRSLRLIAVLLAVWFTVSLGLGVLFAAPLNGIRFFGFPLGFWFAQQGAILVFLGLLVVNAVAMDRIERTGNQQPANDPAGPAGGAATGGDPRSDGSR